MTGPMKSIKSICVFCGSSSAVDPGYLSAAFELGRCIGREGIGRVYGGGCSGLMGWLGRGVDQGGEGSAWQSREAEMVKLLGREPEAEEGGLFGLGGVGLMPF